MTTIWNKITAWLASKGGFAHVVAATYIFAVLAYANVPEFHALVLSIHQALPSWMQELVSTGVALYAFYKTWGAGKKEAAGQAAGQKTLSVLFACCLLGGAALLGTQAKAQDVSNLYMAGGSYNAGGSPAFAGTALYAHQLNSSGTYAFTLVDALPASTKPFTVTTNIGIGVAQRVATINGLQIFMPTSAGISYTGSNTGWSWSTGAGVPINLKGNWFVMPSVRVLKSSVSGGAGYQPIVGVLFGWGQ